MSKNGRSKDIHWSDGSFTVTVETDVCHGFRHARKQTSRALTIITNRLHKESHSRLPRGVIRQGLRKIREHELGHFSGNPRRSGIISIIGGVEISENPPIFLNTGSYETDDPKATDRDLFLSASGPSNPGRTDWKLIHEYNPGNTGRRLKQRTDPDSDI